ncbi:MAG: DUF3306 domain-containing protein [Burkholderiaceae bacterium]|nr:DUF3306 domain-containing protein [Burkholderiaceae bacterium]
MNERFLSRWSRRKHDSRRDEAHDREEPSAAQRADAESRRSLLPQHGDATSSPAPVPGDTGAQRAADDAATRPASSSEPAPELPPIDSLTPESDFRVFMRPGVDGSTRNAALAQLFRDPRYNEMDGLDVYIDDYTQSDPIPSPMLAKLKQLHDIALPDEGTGRGDPHSDGDDDVSPQEDQQAAPGAQMTSDADGTNENNAKPQETQG